MFILPSYTKQKKDPSFYEKYTFCSIKERIEYQKENFCKSKLYKSPSMYLFG